MSIRSSAILLALCIATSASAQPQEPQVLPEEVLILGERSLQQMFMQMMEAEQTAYDAFNKFNDEKRFKISCSMHKTTGTLLDRQICQPAFEREAMRTHGQAYYADLYDLLDPYTAPNSSQTAHIPVEALIASQQQDYKRKMRQVAEEHPEFLDAIIRYSELRERYQQATSMGGNND